MRIFRTIVSALAVWAMTAATTVADDIGSVVTPTGVNVQTHIEAGTRLVIAVVPTMDVKLNGQLGIGFTPLDDQMVWTDSLPSVVMVEGDYFEGPVLQTMSFDPEYLNAPAVLGITFGACLPVSGVCILEEAEVTLEHSQDGSIGLTLATVTP